MTFSARLQLLTCLVLYASCAHAIMVKFGTKGGPIEPPPAESVLPPAPLFRTPAPVWEERSNDKPDPNAQWRPQLFIAQPRYTHVVYNTASSPPLVNNAQRFVNSYVPRHEPVQAQPVQNYFNPSQILSSQSLPGFGIRYFVPAYLSDLQQRKEHLKQEDARQNQIDNNDIGTYKESTNDLQWKQEKDAANRIIRNTAEGSPYPYPYQWPAFVQRRYQ